MNCKEFQNARFEDKFQYIIDSEGKIVDINDPKVVHIFPYSSSYLMKILTEFYRKRGWNCRIVGKKTADILPYAKKICSGRECISFSTIIGSTYYDILKNYNEEEISLYYGLDQGGPCQVGAWPVINDIFTKRLKLKNTLFPGHASIRNNYFGQGDKLGMETIYAVILGDIFDEAENTIKCIAKEKDSAIKLFKEETHKVIKSAFEGIIGLEKSLKTWAKRVSQIPKKMSIEDATKVLIIGGGAVPLIHHDISEFLLKENIIVKVIDLFMFISHVECEPALRYGYQMNIRKNKYENIALLLALLNPKNESKKALEAFRSGFGITTTNFLLRRLRKIAYRSGLLINGNMTFKEIVKNGNKYVSENVYHEATDVIGEYICAINDYLYDGIIHLSNFSCPPSIQAHTILRKLASRNEIPFIGIELEGAELSTNHFRLLENLVTRAKNLKN